MPSTLARSVAWLLDQEPSPVDELDRIDAGRALLGDDTVRIGLGGQQKTRHAGGYGRRNGADFIVIDDARTAGHRRDQTHRRRPLDNRRPRFGEVQNAADFDAHPAQISTPSLPRLAAPERSAKASVALKRA